MNVHIPQPHPGHTSLGGGDPSETQFPILGGQCPDLTWKSLDEFLSSKLSSFLEKSLNRAQP